LELATRAKIVWQDGAWLVPAQSQPNPYKVIPWPGAENRECEDFQLRQKPCKHLIATRLVEERDGKREAPPIDTDILPIRKAYTQDWTAYNFAQSVEKDRVQILLHDLCRNLVEPERPAKSGPKPHLVRDAIFAAAFKVEGHPDNAAAALHGHLVRLGRLLLDESHLAFERAFHAADADLHRGLVLVGADRLELFAARNRFLESCGIEKCLPHRLARRRNVVRAFELHAASLLCAMWRGAGSNRTTGMGVAAYRGGSKPHPHREDHRR